VAAAVAGPTAQELSVEAAPRELPERELASAPIAPPAGRRYVGAMVRDALPPGLHQGLATRCAGTGGRAALGRGPGRGRTARSCST
jgi:hypothetical protein